MARVAEFLRFEPLYSDFLLDENTMLAHRSMSSEINLSGELAVQRDARLLLPALFIDHI